MAKKLNKNLVIALSIAGFVITTGAGVLMVATTQNKDPEDLARKAKQCAEQNDWPNAAVYYQRAYQVSQKPIYLVEAGDALYEIGGKELEARALYGKAIVLDENLVEAHSRLLDINLEIADRFTGVTYLEDVRKTAEAILKLDVEDPAIRAKALYGKGIALMGLKDQAPQNEREGVESLTEAVKHAPDNVKYTRKLVGWKLQEANRLTAEANRIASPSEKVHLKDQASALTDEAEALCLNTVELNPNAGLAAVESRCLYATYYMEVKDNDQAEQLFQQAQNLTGDDSEAKEKALIEFAGYWLARWQKDRTTDDAETRHKKRDQAIALLEKAIDAEPDGFTAYSVLANVYLFINKADLAEQACRRRLEKPFQREGLKSRESRAQRYQLLLSLAEAKLRQAVAHPAGSDERQALAEEAEMSVSEALSEISQDARAYHIRGRVNYALSKDREAIQSYEEAERLYLAPNVENKFSLALAYLRENQLGAARRAALEAAALPNATPSIWITYSQILLRLNEPDKALEAAKQALRMDPENLQARLLVSTAQRELGKTPEQDVDFAGARPELISVAARQLADDGKVDEALSLIDTALKENANNVSLIRAAVVICNNDARKSEALARVSDAIAANPDSIELKALKIQIGVESEEERAEQLVALASSVKDEYRRALTLANYYRSVQDMTQMRKQLELAKDLLLNQSTEMARQAGDASLRSIIDQLIDVAAINKDFQEIENLVALATERNLDAAQGMSYRGRSLLQQGRTSEAIDALQQAVELYPTNGRTLAELGEAYYSTNRFNEAQIAFERSHQVQPRNGLVVRRLADLAERMGDRNQFKELIQECKQLIPNDPWVVAKALELKEEESPREGIARREELRSQDPNDLLNLYRLAMLYHQTGNKEKAAECAQQMWEKRKDEAVAERAAFVLRQCDKPDLALDLLNDFVRQAADIDQKAEAQLLIGEHYAAIGLQQQAEREFLAAADIKATQKVCLNIGQFQFRENNFSSAYEWFEKARRIAAENNSPQIATIEQRAIEALIRAGDLDAARKACDSYLSRYVDDPKGVLLDSEISATLGNIEEAVQKLTKVIEMEPRNVAALFQRARYRASLGDWQRALSDLEQIKIITPTAYNFAPRILMARAMARMGQVDQAINELKNVHDEFPDVDNVTAALVSHYMDQERLTDASTLIASLLNQDPDNVKWLAASGEIAMEQENRTKAINNLQKAVVLGKFDSYLTAKLLDAFEHFKMAEQGISFFEKSVPPDRRPPSVIVAYANLLAMRGDIEAALYNYRSALHVSAYSSSEFLVGLINSIDRSVGRKKAFELFEKYPPDEILARADKHIKSALLQAAGKNLEAMEICQRLLDSCDNATEKADLLIRQAMLYDGMDNFEKAKDLYEQSLAINDRNLFALNNLAYILSDKLGKPEMAIPYAKRAVAVNDKPTIRDTLGWTYVQAGMLREAIAELSLARRDDPSFIPAAYHLGEAYRRDSRFQRAATLFREVLETASNDDPDSNEYVALAEEGLRKANENSND